MNPKRILIVGGVTIDDLTQLELTGGIRAQFDPRSPAKLPTP